MNVGLELSHHGRIKMIKQVGSAQHRTLVLNAAEDSDDGEKELNAVAVHVWWDVNFS